jgi:polar amino acid transport system permease protein
MTIYDISVPLSAGTPTYPGDPGIPRLARLAGRGATMLIVTHEVRFARDVADRVVFMDDGVIVEQGPPEQVLDRPREERTRAFLRAVTQGADEAA